MKQATLMRKNKPTVPQKLKSSFGKLAKVRQQIKKSKAEEDQIIKEILDLQITSRQVLPAEKQSQPEFVLYTLKDQTENLQSINIFDLVFSRHEYVLKVERVGVQLKETIAERVLDTTSTETPQMEMPNEYLHDFRPEFIVRLHALQKVANEVAKRQKAIYDSVTEKQ